MQIVPAPAAAQPDQTLTAQVAAFRDAFQVFAAQYPARVVFFGLLREWCDRLPEFLDNTDDSKPSPLLWQRTKGGDRLNKNGRQPDGTLVFTFSIREYAMACMLGLGRACANRNAGNSQAYSGGKNFPERVASMNAILAEMAAAKLFGVRFVVEDALWPRSGHDENRSASDLRQRNVEVRSVRHRNSDPTIKHKDVKEGRIFLVVAPNNDEFTQARILGWGFADDLFVNHGVKPAWWDDEKHGKWDPETGDRQIPQGSLNRCCIPSKDGHVCELAAAA